MPLPLKVCKKYNYTLLFVVSYIAHFEKDWKIFSKFLENFGEFPFFRRADNFQYFHCCSRWLRAWHLFNNFPLPRLPLEHIRAAIKQPLQFLPNFLQFGIFRQILHTCGLRKELGLRDGVQKKLFFFCGKFPIPVDPLPLDIIGHNRPILPHSVVSCKT